MFRPSQTIKKLCEKMKVHFIRRPKNLCSDTSSSESAILHSLKAIGNKIDNIIFLQATSPLRNQTISIWLLNYLIKLKQTL